MVLAEFNNFNSLTFKIISCFSQRPEGSIVILNQHKDDKADEVECLQWPLATFQNSLLNSIRQSPAKVILVTLWPTSPTALPNALLAL